jgi:sec-independent protein translocase protein TatC
MAAALATANPLPPDDQDPDEREGAMSFLDHLEVLRKRLIHACAAVVVGMLIAFAFIDRILHFVLSPAMRVLPPGSKFIYTEPAEAFLMEINLAVIAGIVLAAPYIMYQVWLFIAPGLYSKEKWFAIPFVTLTTVGAICGAAFSHYIVFPYMIAFFGTFASTQMDFMPKLSDTFDLYQKMLLGMTVVFQIPTIVFFLAKMQVVTAGFLWRQFRYAILLAFIAAAILTPSADPWNQTVFAAPMIALYLISIGIAWLVQPKRGTPKPTIPTWW